MGRGSPAKVEPAIIDPPVIDASLPPLRELPKLKRLVLIGTDVTDPGVDEFKKARPEVILVRQAAPAKARPARPVK